MASRNRIGTVTRATSSCIRRGMRPRGTLLLILVMTTGTIAVSATPLDDAVRLQREGRNRDAQRALRALLPELRVSSDPAALARALTAATDASLALGDYEAAIQE